MRIIIKDASSIDENADGSVELEGTEAEAWEVFNGLILHTDQGDFGIAERDGAIEVHHDGEKVYPSPRAHWPELTMYDVISSNIEAMGHDEATETLYVRFKGGAVYRYFGVGASAALSVATDASVGAAFDRYIKAFYEFERVEPIAIFAPPAPDIVDLLFSLDGDSLVFVDAQDEDGKPRKVGEWFDQANGLKSLRLELAPAR